MNNMESNNYLKIVYKAIVTSFDLNEMETWIFVSLSIQWEELSGDTRSRKAYSLIQYICRKNRLVELVESLNQERPQLQLPEVPESFRHHSFFDQYENIDLSSNQNPFEYSCFISYYLDRSNQTRYFIRELKEAFEDTISSYFVNDIKIFCEDPDRRGNNNTLEERQQALCRSVCMILVFSPPYFEENYCVSEYLAMKNLESHRIQTLGEHNTILPLVIPVIYKEGEFPRGLVRDHAVNFSRVALMRGDRIRIDNERHLEKLNQMGQYIHFLYRQFASSYLFDNDCSNFSFPLGIETKQWLDQYGPPLPQRPSLPWT